jgi:hypothetical protein
LFANAIPNGGAEAQPTAAVLPGVGAGERP